mmetsp:Transcript_17929/g.40349  ORF Transcript_17929/g.40349 Transcript_17929/m.40349 type:complete len:266 (-) Transcript_17929:63-860(-)
MLYKTPTGAEPPQLHAPCRPPARTRWPPPWSPKCSAVNLPDGRRGRAAHATRGVERIDAKQLVNQAASDAQHRRAAVVALGVELERLLGGVVIALPARATDVTRRSIIKLLHHTGGGASEASLGRARDSHDLQPAERRRRLERSEAASRHVSELEVLLDRQVAREAHTRVDQDHVEEAKHGRAAVLDLHDLEAAHVLRRDQAERVKDAEGRGDTDVALREHGRRRRTRDRTHGRGRSLEGLSRLQEREGNDGSRLHGSAPGRGAE